MKATVEIKKLNLLSIATALKFHIIGWVNYLSLRLLIYKENMTALKLFTIKVAPIATYGIELIWNHLTYSTSND